MRAGRANPPWHGEVSRVAEEKQTEGAAARERRTPGYDRGVRRVSGLSIAPVKSLALLHPDEVDLDASGVRENRRFYLVDDAGRVLNGLRCGRLVAVVPTFDVVAKHLTLRFPDGSTTAGTVALGDPVETDWTVRAVTGRVVDGPWAAALSDFVGRPVRLVWSE